MPKAGDLMVLLLLLAGLALRLSPLLQSTGLAGADTFFHAFVVDSTLKAGAPPAYDPFSWGGRPLEYPTGFHLLLSAALLATGLPDAWLVVFGALFFSFAFLAAYAWSAKRGIPPALACGLLAATPVLIWKTTTNLLPDSLWLFLFFFLVFLAPRSPAILAPVLLAASLVHPMMAFAYLFLLMSSRSRFRTFLIILLLVLSAGAYFFLFRIRAVADLSQNVPVIMRPEIFEGASPLKMLERTGPSAVLSLLAFPAHLTQLLIPLVPAAFRLIELDRALSISSLAAALAGAVFLSRRRNFARAWIIAVCFVWAFLKLSSLSWGPVLPNSLAALHWTKENAPRDAVILSSPGDGYLVAYIGKMRNFIDGRFSGRADSDSRLAALGSALADPALSPAKYLLITERSKYELADVGNSWRPRLSLPGEEDSAFVYTSS